MRLPTRPALVRLARILNEIRDGRTPNASTLARTLEVTPRTIQRDLDYLRDQLGAPIEYDRKSHGYFSTDPSYQLPVLSVTEGELLALFLAERALQQYRDTPFATELRRLFEKLTVLLPDKVSLHLDHLTAACDVRHNPADLGNPDRFRRLLRAVQRGRQLELLYWSASRDQTCRRVVDPYHLASVEGDWYLVAHCHLREEVRMFAPARIRELTETGETVDRPADFRIADYLDVGFRRMRGAGPVQTVRLRFTPAAARYIRERAWHPSQKLHEEPDGGVTLTMHVNSLFEVKRWVLSFGAECEVIEPDELRAEIADEIARIQHREATPSTARHRQAASRRSRNSAGVAS
jgi:predicted DNA-binding transcriptional regulator YafY